MATMFLSPRLRRVLLADALISGATGLLLVGEARFLPGLLAMPEPLLRAAALVLLPYALFVTAVATHATTVRVAAVIILNALWAAASLGLLASGQVAPSGLGYAFVLVQAATVAVFAELQFLALRRSPPQVA